MTNFQTSNIANLPTKHGDFKIKAYKEGEKEHLAIFTQGFELSQNPLVRIHSECLTGDTIGSLKCDCGEQLNLALDIIATQGGIVIYHRQEGRNIGLLNKVNAYHLQDSGYDTVEANHQLGFEADMRTYDVVDFILEDFGIKSIRLLTNNPNKLVSLKSVTVVQRVPLQIAPNPHNQNYLAIKKQKLDHLL